MRKLQFVPTPPFETFAVVYTRGYKLPRERDFALVASGFRSELEAGKVRTVTGDLVINARTLEVSQSKAWLWKWERLDKTSFPRKMQQKELVQP